MTFWAERQRIKMAVSEWMARRMRSPKRNLFCWLSTNALIQENHSKMWFKFNEIHSPHLEELFLRKHHLLQAETGKANVHHWPGRDGNCELEGDRWGWLRYRNDWNRSEMLNFLTLQRETTWIKHNIFNVLILSSNISQHDNVSRRGIVCQNCTMYPALCLW